MDLNPINYYNPIFAPPLTKILHPPMESTQAIIIGAKQEQVVIS
jgi:hypothetical protein